MTLNEILTAPVNSFNVGNSNYSTHAIQPWDIWQEYKLNAWDADIVKRVLREKPGTSRIEDYAKIIHICRYRIEQLVKEQTPVESVAPQPVAQVNDSLAEAQKVLDNDIAEQVQSAMKAQKMIDNDVNEQVESVKKAMRIIDSEIADQIDSVKDLKDEELS